MYDFVEENLSESESEEEENSFSCRGLLDEDKGQIELKNQSLESLKRDLTWPYYVVLKTNWKAFEDHKYWY